MESSSPMRKTDGPFDQMIQQAMRNPSIFVPIVGYLHKDGTTSEYTHGDGYGPTWLNRAIATCFGSAARRMRGLHSFGSNQSPIIAILMVVQSDGKVVWKHRLDVPKGAFTRAP